jgi:hypothetical protein
MHPSLADVINEEQTQIVKSPSFVLKMLFFKLFCLKPKLTMSELVVKALQHYEWMAWIGGKIRHRPLLQQQQQPHLRLQQKLQPQLWLQIQPWPQIQLQLQL